MLQVRVLLGAPFDRKTEQTVATAAFAYMPRYYFDTTADRTPVDAEGETLPNDAAACASAVASLSELLPGRAPDLIEGGSFGVTVAREDGTVFYRIEAVATEL